MSFTKVVKNKNGHEKTVIASTQEELDAAVRQVEQESTPTYPNINKPVEKGHDLVEVQEDLSVDLVDGTGAHNSPRDAVKDGGKAEGAWKGDEEPAKKQVPVHEDTETTKAGETRGSDLPPKAEQAKEDKQTSKTKK